jgi:hypothetical protein
LIALIVLDSPVIFFAGIHHERTVLHYRFALRGGSPMLS